MMLEKNCSCMAANAEKYVALLKSLFGHIHHGFVLTFLFLCIFLLARYIVVDKHDLHDEHSLKILASTTTSAPMGLWC